MTSRWGPNLWKSLNAICRSFPEKPTDKDRIHYKSFFESLGHVLPCPKCQRHYVDYMKTIDWDTVVKSRKDCVDFIINFHNNVNVRLGKKPVKYTRAIQLVYDESSISEWYTILLITLIIVIIITRFIAMNCIGL